jgi:hypothetical protein
MTKSRGDLLAYCLSKPGAWVDEPWEGDQVVKVADKIFAFLGAYQSTTIGLKCGRSAEEAREWRDQYPSDVIVARRDRFLLRRCGEPAAEIETPGIAPAHSCGHD